MTIELRNLLKIHQKFRNLFSKFIVSSALSRILIFFLSSREFLAVVKETVVSILRRKLATKLQRNKIQEPQTDISNFV